MITKRCAKCSEVKPSDLFSRSSARKDGRSPECKECVKARRNTPEGKAAAAEYAKAYYQRNAPRERERALARYHANPEPTREKRRKANRDPAEYELHKQDVILRQRRRKARVFAHYGAKCACCGESREGFLTIDHIEGCGKDLRKAHGLGGTFYRWLVNNGFPEGFQVLCYNCNMGRAKFGGVCPHKLG